MAGKTGVTNVPTPFVPDIEKEIVDLSVPPGAYVGYLYKIGEISTKFGPSLKFFYFLDTGKKILTVNELAGEYYTTNSKFSRRIAAVNGRDQLEEGKTIAAYAMTGFCLLVISPKPDGYPEIASVTPLKANDPRIASLQARLESEKPDGWSGVESLPLPF